ncbi:MAG: metallophosphoesterase [Saprospiraceae bacterium]|nr:metallophosphoesterase [Saprospiraceae bacterium]
MKPILFYFIFIILFSFESSAQTLKRSELLGRPTDNSITIKLFFADDADVRVQYGTVSGIYTNQTNWQIFEADTPVEITISDLQADTKYYYRINYRQPNASTFTVRSEYSFHTQRMPSSSFTFIVQADPHVDNQSDTALYSLCLKNQLDDQPDFMIDLGDFLMTDKLKNTSNVIPHDTIPYRCNLMRSFYEKTGHSVPLFIALGNHEGESGWNLNGTENNIAIWGTKERQKYFINPTPNYFYTGDTTNFPFVGERASYYAWRWGDAEFIVLDPYWSTSVKPDSLHGWRWTLGKTQYDWLKATLENSTASFKFVFAHQLIGGDPDGRGGVEFADKYEWGGNNLDGTSGFDENRPGWYKPIKDLLTEHKVNIFFHGHDHFFGKQEKDCMIYQETPQPSHPNFSNVNYAEDYGYVSGQILPQSGHLRVNVSPSGVKVEYVRAYLPQNETATRHNKDISATYFIGSTNCYDSLSTGVPVIWNSNYADEIVYPNPFSFETKIEFSLIKPEKIVLSIYNESGRLVRTLIAGNLISEGRYQLTWDGKDSTNQDQPNGTYFYSINGESTMHKSGKIILIK